MTNEDLIFKTLEYINDKGFVDIKPFWFYSGIPYENQRLVKDILLVNECISLGYGQPYFFEITIPKGVDILKKTGQLKKGELDVLPQQIKIKKPNLLQKINYPIKSFFVKIWNTLWAVIIGGTMVLIIWYLIYPLLKYLLPKFDLP